MGEAWAGSARARLLQRLAEGVFRATSAVCRGCGREFDVSDATSANTLTCPGCQARIEAPPPPALPMPGRYRVIETLGRGAMGVVYRAEDSVLHRDVALKLVSRVNIASPGNIERFRREAQAMAQIDHPNVVKLYDIGEFEGDPYLVMELVRGEHLAGAFARRPMRARVELIEKVARGVQAVHEHGIVHRDLKPQNVLVDENGRPHVTDFGLARLEDGAPLTRDGLAIGTPPYMAPEQIRGGSIDARTDVFALGAMLYEALTAQAPHAGSTVAEILHAILTLEPPPPRSLNARVPADLETICLHAIEKDPARRYPTAHAFADDLRRYLDGEAIAARRPTALKRIWRFASRRRAVVIPVTAAAAGMLAVYAVLRLTTPDWQIVESNWREAEERTRLSEAKTAAMARVNGALERMQDLLYDGTASGENLRQRALETQQIAQEMARTLPSLIEAYVARGRARRLLGDDTGAREDFDRALRRHDRLGDAYFWRGRLSADDALRARFAGVPPSAGEIGSAVQDFEAAIRIGTSNERDAHLARLWIDLLSGDRDAVVTEASRVIALGGRVEDDLYVRGLAQTDPRAAAADFDEALRRRPNDAWLRFVRGTCRMELKEYAEAIEDLSKAIDLRPDFAEAYLQRGRGRRARGEHQAAAEDLERAAALGLSSESKP
ncbi:MAG: protein kinase [Planctomycetes bacterium]|nr:protein kinase [Planctomycetota bacterium]